jgi:hypothetical protein
MSGDNIMSELTSCNRCKYELLKILAIERKEKLVLIPNINNLGGTSIFMLKQNESIPLNPNKQWKDEHFVAWFMELSDECCC